MKRAIIAFALIVAGCASVAPGQGPIESPNTPLVVLENSGRSAGEVNDHYDDVNRITEELFSDR